MTEQITKEDVERNIKSVSYFTALDGVYGEKGRLRNYVTDSDSFLEKLTFCVIALTSGYMAVGIHDGSCLPDFSAARGREIARERALAKIAPLIGRELSEALKKEPLPDRKPEFECCGSPALCEQPCFHTVADKAQVRRKQIGGDHYINLSIQPWDAMEAWMTPEQFEGFLLGNAIAYLGRYNTVGVPGKGGVADAEKAAHNLERLIALKKVAE